MALLEISTTEGWVTTMMAQEFLGDLLPSQRIGPAGRVACRNRWAAGARSGSAALRSTDSRIYIVAPYECFTGRLRNIREHKSSRGRLF